jgi:hypothetical protein
MTALNDRVWTAVEEQTVAAMLIEGVSAAVIANMFQLSRNAVIGRIHRNPNLQFRARPGKGNRARPRSKRIEMIEDEPKPARIVPPRIEPTRPMPLIETGSRYCKWPVEYDERLSWLCCGRQVAWGLVYCAPHERAARPRRVT